MAVIFLDSFDDRLFANGQSYATYHAKWDTVSEDSTSTYANSISQVTGVTGKACLVGGSSYLEKSGFQILSGNPLTWGYSLKVTAAPASDTTITSVTFTDGTTNVLGTLKYVLTTTLYIKIIHNVSGTDYDLATSASALSTNTFYFLESTVYGTVVDLYKDGSNWLSVPNVTPVSMIEPVIDRFRIQGGVIFDNLYLKDDSTKLGQIYIDALVPTSDSLLSRTRPWQGRNYLDTDECYQVNHDNDSTFDRSNVQSPSSISYNFNDKSSVNIYAVQSLSWVLAYRSSGSPGNITFTAITNVSSTDYSYATTLTLAPVTITNTNANWKLLKGIWTNNPATSSSWTTTTFNSAEFGVTSTGHENGKSLGYLTAVTLELVYAPIPSTARYFIIS